MENGILILQHRFPRRSRWEIITGILEAASNGTRVTRLMHKANVDYRSIRKYLEFLDKHAFLKIVSTQKGGKIVKITERGCKLLEKIREVNEILPENSFP